MVTLFNVISSDGYIAGKGGSEDFIPDGMWPSTVDLFNKYDAIVMGRKSYDALQGYPRKLLEPFEKSLFKKIVVSGDRDFYPKPGYAVAHSPEDAVASASDILIASGPVLNTYLLKKRLVDKVVFRKLPVEIGDGLKPFDADTENALMPLSRKSSQGFEELAYRVNKASSDLQ